MTTNHAPTPHTVDCEARQKVREAVFCTCVSPNESAPIRIAGPFELDGEYIQTVPTKEGFKTTIARVDFIGPIGMRKATAAFIVSAVNSHDEMLQTLKHVQDLAEENTKSPQDGYCQIAEWAQNQIAKSEGRA